MYCARFSFINNSNASLKQTSHISHKLLDMMNDPLSQIIPYSNAFETQISLHTADLTIVIIVHMLSVCHRASDVRSMMMTKDT